MNCQTTSNPVTARLRVFAMISLMLGASLSAHAQSGGVIEQDCGVNPDDQEHEVFLFFARYGVFLQQSPSQVMPDPRGMDLSSGDGIVSLPFAASLIFIPGTNSVIEPLLRHGEVVETSPESEFGALMKDFAFDKNEWNSGEINDLHKGKNYRAFMKLNKKNQLEVTGYILFRWLSQTLVLNKMEPAKQIVEK